MWGRHHVGVPVGVVDVGSNTVRLLVSEHGRTVLSERAMLRLGADIERHGEIPEEKLARTSSVVAGLVADARSAGAQAIEILIASPGRQAANGAELADRLQRAAGCRARILTSVEEGHLAFLGALSCARVTGWRTVAVVDVGGGSAQITVGSRKTGPTWTRSIDLGSQRLTSRLLSQDPPGPDAIEQARAEVERYLNGVEPPAARTTLAVGGSARALKRIAGARLGSAELDDALTQLATTPTAVLARQYGDRRGAGAHAAGRCTDPRRDPTPPRPSSEGSAGRPARRRAAHARGRERDRGLGALHLRDDSQLVVEHEGRALAPLARIVQCVLEAAVAADDHILSGELLQERTAVVPLAILGELLARDELQPARGGERLDGLDAAERRARVDRRDAERSEARHEVKRLLAPALVQWPYAVVALPRCPIARRSMTHEDRRHLYENAFRPLRSADCNASG